jgi:hypothetical protein
MTISNRYWFERVKVFAIRKDRACFGKVAGTKEISTATTGETTTAPTVASATVGAGV